MIKGIGRLFLLVSLSPSLLVSQTWAVVAKDADSSSSGSAASNLTWSHTVTGSNTLLICLAAIGDGGNVSSFTFNSVPLTISGSRDNGASYPSHRIEMWYLIAPATGAHTVSLTLPTAATRLVGGCTSFTGANQSTPLGTPVTNPSDGTVDASAISITVPTNGLAYGGVAFSNASGTCTAVTMVNGAMVKGFDTCVGVAADNATGSSATRPSSGGISWTNLSGAFASAIAVPISEAAGTVAKPRRMVVIMQ
jgi:hypothetical protein